MKIRLRVADLFHVDGQTNKLNTDRYTQVTKLILAFRSFAISPKSSYVIACYDHTRVKNVVKLNHTARHKLLC